MYVYLIFVTNKYCVTLVQFLFTSITIIAGPASKQDEEEHVLWFATQAGKIFCSWIDFLLL